MWLRALAGAYAGEVRDYRTDVGLRALRSGTAERVVDAIAETVTPLAPRPVAAAAPLITAAALPIVPEKSRKRQRR